MSGVQFVPGGATQNSMRVAQWLLQVPGAVSYFGCVGKDKYSKIMEDTARKEGLNVRTAMPTAGSAAWHEDRLQTKWVESNSVNALTALCAAAAQTLYQVDSSTPTGTCATAVLKGERSLVANLAAANNYKARLPPRPAPGAQSRSSAPSSGRFRNPAASETSRRHHAQRGPSAPRQRRAPVSDKRRHHARRWTT